MVDAWCGFGADLDFSDTRCVGCKFSNHPRSGIIVPEKEPPRDGSCFTFTDAGFHVDSEKQENSSRYIGAGGGGAE